MPTRLHDRRDVRRLMEYDAQLAEVLPRQQYEHEHLPGAVHVPLTQLDRMAAERLDRARAVVVYCSNSL
ncbi:MAG: hypothetical protein GEV03_20845 [Streptosporangiales bacterium]|nr:hypothetical protein [Streptosporangiales bacterium]